MVPIHNHTHYSALDGLSKPSEIVERIQSIGLGACGITDHDVVTGHYDFYNTMTEAGLKPILGIEAYQTFGARQVNKGFRTDPKTKDRADNFHLIMLAMNDVGLRNLWTINSESHSSGFYYNSRTDWDLLERYNEGVIVTSACGIGGLAQAVRGNLHAPDPDQLVQKYLSIFGDRFYIELSTYGESWQWELNEQLVELAHRHSVPIVYANDAHYASPDQFKLHESVLCMQYQEKVSQRTEPHHAPDLYIMDEKDVERALNHLDTDDAWAAIDNSDDLAGRCNVTFPGRKHHIPVFIPDKKYATAREMLFDLAKKGYEEKIIAKGLDSDKYMGRFEDEIKIIYDADLVDYFLIVRDFIEWAMEKNYLVGPGRGSVGGSLIAYLIDVTQIDPVKYGLIFERFYNAGREGSLPDIDTDFPTFGREAVKAYLADKYGKDYVADIGTTTSYQGRNAIQKLGSAFEIPYGDIRKISNTIEGAIESGLQPDWTALNEIHDLQRWRAKYPQLFADAEALFGNTFTYGVHASGFLISDVPVASHYPVRWHAKDQKVVTQWDMRTADKLGFMKIDILGIRTLDTLMELNNILQARGEQPINFYEVQDMACPDEMYELAHRGLTVGLFQIEEGTTAKDLCRKIKPRSIEEMALITAINRPGPLIAGSHIRYLKGLAGEEVKYVHPLVEAVTGETFGEFVYQEQVIEFFTKIGYTLQEADAVRAAMGKKLRKEMAKEYDRYLENATKHMNKATAQKIWDLIESFAKYAFNKSHSIAYGIILKWTLYAKWMYPQDFYLAAIRVLTREGMKDRIPAYIREAPKMKIPVFGPELNKSMAETTVNEGGIRYGYADVKGIGITAARWLEENQPFKDYDHITEVAQEKKITLKNGLRRVAVNAGQIGNLKALAEAEGKELITLEEELLGFPLSDRSEEILDQYEDMISNLNTFTEVLNSNEEKTYQVAGIITKIKETKTKTGNPMAFVTIERGGESLDMTMWYTEMNDFKFALKNRLAGIFTIKAGPRGLNLRRIKILFDQEN